MNSRIELPGRMPHDWYKHTTARPSHSEDHLLKEPKELEWSSVQSIGVDLFQQGSPEFRESYENFTVNSPKFKFLFLFSKHNVRVSIDEKVLSDATEVDFYEYSAYVDDYSGDFLIRIGNLRRQLWLWMAKWKTSFFKEELMQKVFHPSKIEARLAQGLSIDEAF